MGRDFYTEYAAIFAAAWVFVCVFALYSLNRLICDTGFVHRLTVFSILALSFLRLTCTTLRANGNIASAELISRYAAVCSMVTVVLVCIELHRCELRNRRRRPPG